MTTEVLPRIIKQIDIAPGAVDADKRQVAGWISTIDVDMEGDVVLPDAMDDSYFESVKAVTLYHDDRAIVGTNVNIARRAKGLWALTQMSNNALGRDTLLMIREGVIRCYSIEADHRTLVTRAAMPEDRRKYGEDARRIWERWKMVGYSFVGKPMNPNAQIVEKGSRAVDEVTVKGLEAALGKGLILRESAVMMGLPDTAERKFYRIGGDPPARRVRILDGGTVILV